MIPLDTRPGTEVIFLGHSDSSTGPFADGAVSPPIGAIVRVAHTNPTMCSPSRGVATIDGYAGFFCLSCFDLRREFSETEPCA